MTAPKATATTPKIIFDNRSDWTTFPSAGFPVTGTVNPANANWNSFVGQVLSSDFSTVIIDNILVTFDSTTYAWKIATIDTSTLVHGTTYQLVVKAVYGAYSPSAFQQFTFQ